MMFVHKSWILIIIHEEYHIYNEEGLMLYSFFLCKVLHKDFLQKVFDEATCAIQIAVDM